MNIKVRPSIKRKRGRPKCNPFIGLLKTNYWLEGVSAYLPAGSNQTGYAYEKLTANGVFEKNIDNEVIRPCYADKLLTNNRNIGDKKALEVEKAIGITKDNATSKRCTHPAWSIIDTKPISLDKLHHQMLNLRPEIASILFRINENNELSRTQVKTSLEVEELTNEGDFDALIACIGCMHEANIQKEYLRHTIYALAACHILLRITSNYDFWTFSNPLFEYLKLFFFFKTDNKIFIDYVNDINLQEKHEAYKFILRTIGSTGVTIETEIEKSKLINFFSGVNIYSSIESVEYEHYFNDPFSFLHHPKTKIIIEEYNNWRLNWLLSHAPPLEL